MSTSDTTSGSDSGTTSSTEPSKLEAGSETEYLQAQIQQGQEALQRVMHDFVQHLGTAADPRAWVKQYPLAGLGSALALGFVVGWGVTPDKEQSINEKWHELLDKLHKQQEEQTVTVTMGEPSSKPGKPSMLGKLGQQIFDIAKAALASGVTAAVAAKSQPGGDGQPGS